MNNQVAPTTTAEQAPAAQRDVRSLPQFASPTGSPDELFPVTKLFGEYFTGAIVTLPQEIRTSRVFGFYRRDFLYLSQLLLAIDNYRKIPGVPTAIQVAVEKSEDKVSKVMESVIELASGRKRELAAAISANNHDMTACAFAKPVYCSVPVINPLAREYLGVLSTVDSVFELTEKAWILGLIDRKERGSHDRLLKEAVRRIAVVVREERITLAARVNSFRTGADRATQQLIDETTTKEAAGLLDQSSTDPQGEEAASPQAEEALRQIVARSTTEVVASAS